MKNSTAPGVTLELNTSAQYGDPGRRGAVRACGAQCSAEWGAGVGGRGRGPFLVRIHAL